MKNDILQFFEILSNAKLNCITSESLLFSIDVISSPELIIDYDMKKVSYLAYDDDGAYDRKASFDTLIKENIVQVKDNCIARIHEECSIRDSDQAITSFLKFIIGQIAYYKNKFKEIAENPYILEFLLQTLTEIEENIIQRFGYLDITSRKLKTKKLALPLHWNLEAADLGTAFQILVEAGFIQPTSASEMANFLSENFIKSDGSQMEADSIRHYVGPNPSRRSKKYDDISSLLGKNDKPKHLR